MKNYSSNRCQKGKTAYRTPSLFKANKALRVADIKGRIGKNNKFLTQASRSYVSLIIVICYVLRAMCYV